SLRGAKYGLGLGTLARGTFRLLMAGMAILALLLLARVAGLGQPAGDQGEIADETWKRIQEEGVLRVGLDASFPPFEFREVDGGPLLGYDIALARELGKRLGIEVEFVEVGFDGLYDALYTGQFDAIISSLPYDPLLTKDFAYSYTYFTAGQVLVVSSREERTRGKWDLKGKVVGVEYGSDGDVEARRLSRGFAFDLRLFTTGHEALLALRRGEVEAVLTDAVTAYQFIGRQGGVKIIGEPLTHDPSYVIAMRPDSQLLLRQINEVLEGMRADGTLEKLIQEWF
ncbi:MAG: substrate-binding periplasmic protein, partial [Anaerolineae bacterium]